jgi:ATP-dependent helicase HrpB
MLGAIVLHDAPLRDVDPQIVADTFMEGVRSEGVAALPWSDAATRLRQRMMFMARHDASWPDVSDEALSATMAAWLGPHVAGLRRLTDLQRVDLVTALGGLLDWKQRAALDDAAPTHLVVPSGSRIPVDYSDPDVPVLAVRLQEMFGCMDTPRIGGGRVAVTLHLLSPASRPVQVTRDLAGFWRTTYFEVRKDLRGRYPKHHWPDDPLAAPPTHRAKRRG